MDFITPVVNDPFIFGQIAASNSLSDIFAMGGEALNALNLVGFDSKNFSDEILSEILLGAKDRIKESGAILVGGHSIQSSELFFGLSVLGKVDPNKFYSNNSAKVGDKLILTKPIGTGIISSSLKAKFLSIDEASEAINSMILLNSYAVDVLKDIRVNACTDITGFGLLGHMSEMLNNDISFKIFIKDVPKFEVVKKCMDNGFITGGSYRNAKFVPIKDPDLLLCDPQTSGGLLISVDEKDANLALKRLRDVGYIKANIIGEVVPKSKERIKIIN